MMTHKPCNINGGCGSSEQAVTLLEKMKHDITNILQEFDQEKNDEQDNSN